MSHAVVRATCALWTLASWTPLLAADPWADSIVNYTPGANANPSFTDDSTALGEPTRFTSPSSPFGGPTTPFQSAFGSDEVVTIGEGGSLTVRFDEPVTNDASNPFGIDLLIFGNSSYIDTDFPNGVASTPAALFSEGGTVEVSTDGVTFFLIAGAEADGAFPTLGYKDTTEAFPSTAGTRPTDFTRPVNPNFDASGLNVSQIVDAYNGSGGGLGIDIGSVGLSSISYVRIANPVGSGMTPEIDAFADVSVPAPAGAGTLTLGMLALASRRRRASTH